ncbi:TfpX/TfpZ family type IV pilin accessory protein [Pseudomonas sp. EA_35y_Pfl2_R5]|uniref:TfpX/TfpZ family type IV pilin accessory protein n=1 Tax=Pseudomonas sp. EA_35y_Pfl2_R5 TaxID=3088690 RepID=UPI0030DBE0F0
MPLRFKAFFIHLSLSAVLAVPAVLLVFKLWYPAPLHVAVGVTKIFLLLLLVDVVLGPLLTLLVYKPGKKTLVLDLTVIAMLQLSALCYGLWVVAEGRPAWLVFNSDRFDLVRVLDIDGRKLSSALPEYRSPPQFGPRWVAAVSPVDAAARNELMFEAGLGGSDLPQRPDLYRPLVDVQDEIRQRSRSISGLQDFNSVEDVQAVTREWPAAGSWLPLMAGVPMVVLLHKESYEVLAVVDLRPWL